MSIQAALAFADKDGRAPSSHRKTKHVSVDSVNKRHRARRVPRTTADEGRRARTESGKTAMREGSVTSTRGTVALLLFSFASLMGVSEFIRRISRGRGYFKLSRVAIERSSDRATEGQLVFHFFLFNSPSPKQKNSFSINLAQR